MLRMLNFQISHPWKMTVVMLPSEPDSRDVINDSQLSNRILECPLSILNIPAYHITVYWHVIQHSFTLYGS